MRELVQSSAEVEEKTSEVRMLAWHSQSMEVWRWKVTSRGRVPPHAAHLPGGQAVAADKDREWVEEPRYAVRIETAPDGGRVACAGVSRDGAWIGCGLSRRFALYQLAHTADGSVDVTKSVLPKALVNTGVRALVFLHGDGYAEVCAVGGLQAMIESFVGLPWSEFDTEIVLVNDPR